MMTAKEAVDDLVELAGGDRDLAFKMLIDWLDSREGKVEVDNIMKKYGAGMIGAVDA